MWLELLIVCIKALVFIVFVLTYMALLMWMEHKQSAVMQDRLGINRVYSGVEGI
jgi:NADH:ubiquinone oxidoreductase subunit H